MLTLIYQISVAESLATKDVADEETTVELVQGSVLDTSDDQTSNASWNNSETQQVIHPLDESLQEPVITQRIMNEQSSLEILGQFVQPGTREQLSWVSGQNFSGKPSRSPVIIIRGRYEGPVLCLTAAVHGDELNGIDVVRHILMELEPMALSGTVIGVPIVNQYGFTSNTRYLSDRRDLNRYFPGNPSGSAASRIAHRLFSQVIAHCDYLVDFHTASFKRNNMPQLRANMHDPSVKNFVDYFGNVTILHKPGHKNTLRAAASRAGTPTVTFEIGEPGTIQVQYVQSGIESIRRLLENLAIVDKTQVSSDNKEIFYRSSWVRTNAGGVLISEVESGQYVNRSDVLGTIFNPLDSSETRIVSPYNGRVLGLALNQFVIPGYAAYHIGISADHSSWEMPEENDVDKTHSLPGAQQDESDPEFEIEDDFH